MRMSFGERTSAPGPARLRWHERPRFCFYYVTDLCNAACRYCHFGDITANDGRRHFAAVEDVERNLEAMRPLGVRFVDFTGGEPLLHPRILHLLTVAKAHGFTTGMTTNGTVFERHAAGLRGLVDHLEFSLDAAHAAVHEERREGTSFEQVQQNLRIARELGMRPAIVMTVNAGNVGEIEEVCDIARAFGVR